MKILILITSDPFVKSVKQGLEAGKKQVNYWTNGVLPQGDFQRVDIFNGEKLILQGRAVEQRILPLEQSFEQYNGNCGGMLSSVEELKGFLQQIFGEIPDPIGNIILADCLFDPEGLPCDYQARSTEKFTLVEV